MDDKTDAATFRAICDRLFHNCPLSVSDGTLQPNEAGRRYWAELSRHTYRNGERGPIEARRHLRDQ